jgi:hypothetical protein
VEDDLKKNGRRPQTKMEDVIKKKWKTISTKKIEDNLKHNKKINLNWL